MAPLILIFISPFKANFPHKVSAHECFDASKQLNWRVKHLEACERRFWKWNRFRDLISDTNPGAPMPDRNRRKGRRLKLHKTILLPWNVLVNYGFCQFFCKYAKEVPNSADCHWKSKDCKYFSSGTVLSDWANWCRLQDPFPQLEPRNFELKTMLWCHHQVDPPSCLPIYPLISQHTLHFWPWL